MSSQANDLNRVRIACVVDHSASRNTMHCRAVEGHESDIGTHPVCMTRSWHFQKCSRWATNTSDVSKLFRPNVKKDPGNIISYGDGFPLGDE
jgi:hypothetical protein